MMTRTIPDKSELPNENVGTRTYNVLLVEDNADDAELFLRTLRKTQMDVELEIDVQVVSNSADATIKFKAQGFDAIFVDVGLPPPDGIELSRRIRTSDSNRTTPIIIMTGADDRGLMARAFQAGANFFLFKPVSRPQLLRLIQMSRAPIDRERRRLQRVNVKCKVSISSDKGKFDGETVDLCLGGMLVKMNALLPIGSMVKVSLTLPPATAPIRSSARIVRAVGNEMMGLQLEGLGRSESDQLGTFLVPLIVASTSEKVA
jgi:CheY-like chemotaxis protein